jgi:hypothetical protein
MSGERSWLLVLAGVIAIDAFAPEGQTLSEAVHRLKARHPALVWAAVIATGIHFLAGDHPQISRVDVYRALGWALRRTRF